MAKLVLIDGEGVADLSDGTHWGVGAKFRALGFG